jgi:precorrin-6Y C5,15-methyltransferase (decarboxylating)
MNESFFSPRIFVVGIGYRPLDKRAREAVLNAGSILASVRLFDIFRRYEEFEAVKEKVAVIDDVDETMERVATHISASRSPAVALASGDPLFCGIGRRTLGEFGKEKVEIIPDLSSVQIAFARIKEAWDDAFLISLHHGPDARSRSEPRYRMEDVPLLLARYEKLAILTDRESNPAEIAKAVLSAGSGIQQSSVRMFVCERLGYPEERIVQGTPAEMAANEFSEPNVVVLLSGRPHEGR